MKRLLYLLVFLIFCISVSASEINILTYREEYNPFETFQAEIILDKEPLNGLTILNFEFYGDKQIGIILFLEKLSSKRYFVYFNIPDVERGEYIFRVKNVNIIDGALRRISEEKTIKVNKVNPGFEYLTDNQNQGGNFGDITKTSLSALALKNIDNKKANMAISYLLNNQDPKGCYPVGNCNVKDTSFVLMALSKFNQNYIKTKNWLKDAGNNFGLGVWNLRLEGNGVCGQIQLNGVYNLNVEDNEINITCNDEVDFTLTHNYLGNSYTIYEYTGNEFSYLIDDSGCYGLGYKQSCDYISTLYASWALNEINEDFPEEYLDNNKLDNRTIDHALGYILYNDNYDKDWLLNNYFNGYWSYNSISISQTPDYFVSALSAYALKNEIIFDDAKDYLMDKTKDNVLDSALILYLLFDDEIESPSVSINPGIANKKKSFNLKIKNNKEPITVIIDAPNSTNLPPEAYLVNELNYNINVKESFDIIISYGNYSYTIPIIGPDQILEESLPLLPPQKNAIQFVNEDVELILSIKESLTDELRFINNWNYKLMNITLGVTGNLKNILEIEKINFESIESNETLSTLIYLNQEKGPLYPKYEGDLIIKSSKNTFDSIHFIINFEIEPPATNEEEQIEGVNEEDEKEQIEEETTTTEPSEKKKNLWWLWVIIILVIGTLIFLFLRRKKNVTQTFKEYAEKIKK